MNYDTNKYQVIKLPNPMILHWVLNPGLVVNELILGQRLPAVSLIDKTSDKPLMERSYVPCPTCGEINDSRAWTNAKFGNWYGLLCPKCGAKIPMLWNVFSILVLALTFWLWIPLKVIFEKSVLEKQRAALALPLGDKLPTARKVSGIKLGVMWGGAMFLIFEIQMISGGHFSWPATFANLATWSVGGAMFGAIMKWFVSRRR